MYVGVNNVARKIKNIYVGISELKNLIVPSSVNLNNVTYENGIFTHSPETTAMVSQNLPAPIANHIYYARCYQKAPNDYSHIDGRFEWWAADVAGTSLMTFCSMQPTENAWWRFSSTASLSTPVDGEWQLRSFTVDSNYESYRKELMIIDLTESFGAGNEPSKEWCDLNIPYFEGKYIMPKKWGTFSNKAKKIVKGYVGVNGIAKQLYTEEEA